MRQTANTLSRLLLMLAAAGAFWHVTAGAQDLSTITGENGVHAMSLPERARTNAQSEVMQGSGTPALIYHGGPVMTSVTPYVIFWAPSTLQDGQATSLPESYQHIQTEFLKAYPGHGIDNNNTQYFMTSGLGRSEVTFIHNKGSFGGSYLDTSAYPTSDCTDTLTPGNCLSDSQIQAEVLKVMGLKRWTGGLGHIFFVFTSIGEGSCAGFGCAYSEYCAYHSYFKDDSNEVFYANMPYAGSFCQAGASPNGDAAGDSAASITSHELTETITDPELNAWYSSSGQEIGDLCAWNYGENTWGSANQYWPMSYSNRHVNGNEPITSFELQQEYDNHTASCVQVGP